MLISPAEACRRFLAALTPLPTEELPLDQTAGRTLRAAVYSDRDQPPFDRVTMDGYALAAEPADASDTEPAQACRAEAEPAVGIDTDPAANARPPRPATPHPAPPPPAAWRVVGLQAAGAPPLTLSVRGTAIEIMTGAALPGGADRVVPYENTRRAGEWVNLLSPALPRACVHPRGSDARQGDLLLASGRRLDSRALAVAATVGAATVCVSVAPRILLLSTGDELVPVTGQPGPQQIRRSHAHALRAAVLAHSPGAHWEYWHVRDEELLTLAERLGPALATCDLLLCTGGVSKGRYDHVPALLRSLGVEFLVQGVAQRPGKPLLLGRHPGGAAVCALPGNPVSAYTCLHRYALPALAALAGTCAPPPPQIALAQAVNWLPPLTGLLPVHLVATATGLGALPLPTNTSGDHFGLLGSTGFVELPPGPAEYPGGTVAPYHAWSD